MPRAFCEPPFRFASAFADQTDDDGIGIGSAHDRVEQARLPGAGRTEYSDAGTAAEGERSVDRAHAGPTDRVTRPAIGDRMRVARHGDPRTARRRHVVERCAGRIDRTTEQHRAERRRQHGRIALDAIAARDPVQRAERCQHDARTMQRGDAGADDRIARANAHTVADARAW